MKRLIPWLLIFCFFISGCSGAAKGFLEPVTFYYLSTDYSYGMDSGIIVSETREASGHRQEMGYLMALYLLGPTEETHRSPLPAGTRIHKAHLENGIVKLGLSEHALALTPAQYTLACACLSMTCFNLTDADSVVISCGTQTVTMTRDCLTLSDDSTATTTTEELS